MRLFCLFEKCVVLCCVKWYRMIVELLTEIRIFICQLQVNQATGTRLRFIAVCILTTFITDKKT